ncbi:MAG: terminase family protein [Pseudomonadota bacterium]
MWLETLSPTEAQRTLEDWRFWARPSQAPPEGDWRCWLFMGGRGAGKTRAGAEWLRGRVEAGLAARAALVGPTLGDVREVMIEGPSGLRAIAPKAMRPNYEPSRRRLVWPNGAEAYAFSAEDPDSLRGPQFDAAWCDEIGAWTRGEAVWDMLMMALRLGADPRVAATTTPRATALVRRLAADETVAMTRAATRDNAPWLAPGFVDAVEAAYGGTRLGRQELKGEMIDDPPGALWTRSALETLRGRPGDLERVVVAIDPPASVGASADACGIIAAGVDKDGCVYVLADATCQGLRPLDWAGRAVAVAREYEASEIIAEANQGGEMVREVLKLAGGDTPVRLAHARKSKAARAEPVAALYQKGRVRHARAFPELEDQMCAFGADGQGSPDRVDALVWAVSALALKRSGAPRVRGL